MYSSVSRQKLVYFWSPKSYHSRVAEAPLAMPKFTARSDVHHIAGSKTNHLLINLLFCPTLLVFWLYIMDPLSITMGVLTLVTRSIAAVQTCQTYATRYQLADLSIAATRTECASIRIALLQISNLITQNHGRNVQHQVEEYVLEEYEAVLSACSLTFALLSQKLESLGFNGLNEGNECDVVSKLNFVWKEPTMESIRQSIRRQAIAVTLLLTAFRSCVSNRSTDSTANQSCSENAAKTYEIMKSQEVERCLLSVSDNASSLSILIVRLSDLSTTESILGDEEFQFDDQVIDSVAYRKAFKKQQNKSHVLTIEVTPKDIARSTLTQN
jgi:hypothetical protein